MPDSVPDRVSPQAPILRLRGVSKHYGGVIALQDVAFAASTHSIHAILGENGAGKSTLIKVIAGVVRPDTGTMAIDGRPVRFAGPGDAVAAGVVCVFQELSLVPDLTVAANISIAPAPRRFGLIDKRAQRRRAEELLAQLGCEDLDPLLPVRELSLSRRQLVELAKALGRRPRVLILDEATSALAARDVETINRILRQLRDQGLTVLLISHRMHEIEALADTCSVFRGGRHIETYAQGSRSPGEVLQLMIGREISQVYPPKPPVAPDIRPALEIGNLSWGERLHELSFTVGRGEVVGLGGLDGQGQRSLLLALFGVLRDVKGTIAVGGHPVAIHSPADAKAAGLDLALVPEDRKSEGLMLSMSVRENMVLAALDRLSRGQFIDRKRERDAVDAAVAALAHQGRVAGGSRRHPLGRQPAESGAGEMADEPPADHSADGPDARYRCRHETGILPHHPRPGGAGRRHPVLQHGL